MAKAHVNSETDFVTFATAPSRLITVVGKHGSGKTKFAMGMMQYAIRMRWQKHVDPLRFYYTAATRAFDELARYRFEPESEIHTLLQYSGLLVLDNLDYVHTRYMLDAAALIVARCDTGYSTVITCTDTSGLDADRLGRPIAEGRYVNA